MFKKLSALLLVFIIMAVSSIGAFASPADGAGSTTQPAINSDAKQGGSSTESAITSESAIGNKGAVTGKGAIAAQKPDFETVFDNALKNGTAVNNDQFILTITSPDKDKDSTYMKSYVLSGNSSYNDVVISIAKYNEGTNTYEPMYNTDGESSWEINSTGIFSKEILLSMGTNKIKIMAYRTSQKEEANLDNIQVNSFTIELLNESIIKKVIKKTAEFGKEIGIDITKGLGDLFGKSKAAK